MALLPLIIGSMTPDVIGFLPYALERHLPNSHSPIGTVLVDLPIGYLALLIVMLFRAALVRPLWEPHRSLIANNLNVYFVRPRCWLIALPSLLVGSWTHIVWDRFTHDTHWTYRNLPLLYQPLFPDAPHQLPIFHALQYITSAAGLIYIGFSYWQALQQTRASSIKPPAPALRQKQLLGALAAISLALGAARLLSIDFTYESVYMYLSLILKTAIIAFALLYFIYGLILSTTASGQS